MATVGPASNRLPARGWRFRTPPGFNCFWGCTFSPFLAKPWFSPHHVGVRHLSKLLETMVTNIPIRFIRNAPDSTTSEPRRSQPISGPLFAQYLMSMLGQTDHPMLPLFMGGAPESGRMGDYVFSQEGICRTYSTIAYSLTLA